VAERLAGPGTSVLVLERGRPHPPGDFARTPHRLRRSLWEPAAGLHGLFDVRSFHGFDAIVASGLGGGSLIYANVTLRPDEAALRGWPVDRAALEPHLDAVAARLRARPYPFAATTPKTAATLAAAAALDRPAELPPLAVRFDGPDGADAPGVQFDDGRANLHRRPRRTCSLCGECDLGCNDGAKESLDLSLLSRAVERGAVVRCCADVRGLEPRRDGTWLVRYRQDPGARAGADPALLDPDASAARTVAARRVVLAAGTFGTTALLLRNRAALPGLSPAIGTRMSTNADLLGFVRGADRPLEPSRGPVITASVRIGGGLVQDAGAPAFTEWLWQLTDLPRDLWGLRRVVARRLAGRLTGRRDALLGAELAAALGTTRGSAHMMPVLGMGRDAPTGTLRLRGEQLEADWRERNSRGAFDALEEAMEAVAGALGGRALVPRTGRAVTVHPLGARRWATGPTWASSTGTGASSASRACTSSTAPRCPARSGRTRR
jgi:cholesterol oxidase